VTGTHITPGALATLTDDELADIIDTPDLYTEATIEAADEEQAARRDTEHGNPDPVNVLQDRLAEDDKR
jgi:hypothetical protein